MYPLYYLKITGQLLPDWNSRLDKVLRYMHDHQQEAILGRPDDIAFKAGLNIRRDEAVRMLTFLRDEGYVREASALFFVINLKGVVFIQKGGFTKKASREYWENFPKRFWWAIGTFTFIIGWLTPILTNQLLKDADNDKKDNTIRLEQPIQVKIDTTGK